MEIVKGYKLTGGLYLFTPEVHYFVDKESAEKFGRKVAHVMSEVYMIKAGDQYFLLPDPIPVKGIK